MTWISHGKCNNQFKAGQGSNNNFIFKYFVNKVPLLHRSSFRHETKIKQKLYAFCGLYAVDLIKF